MDASAEAGLGTRLVSTDAYWMFDEFPRQGVLFYLDSGQPIYITLPSGNRTF